ncbi:cupin domain-containing protein, partial [Acinetobacter baumannii]|uniref:cupin domain-containing protein n=1 Tax=Acinetobacter baumannii TaxID=470 RepID=UPI001BB46A01
MIRPDEEEEQQQQGKQPNGLEESICTLRMKRNIDNRRDVEVYSRQAGRIVVANAQNLPVLNVVDMSAEKGTLKPNALYAPHWSSNAHSILYVISGDAQVQVVDDNGQTV